jgi:hypothetical protein
MYAHDTAAGTGHDRAKVVVEQLWRDDGTPLVALVFADRPRHYR